MRFTARLAPIELEQVLPEGGSRTLPLGAFWDSARAPAGVPMPAPRAVVLVFLRHFG